MLVKSEVDDFLESLGTIRGEIGQHFSIDCDLSLSERSNKSGVSCSVLMSCRVNSDDPQAPEFTFLLPAVPISMLERFFDMVFRNSVNLASSAPKPFC